MTSDEFKGPFVIGDQKHWPTHSTGIRDMNGRELSYGQALALLNRSPTGLTAWVPEGWGLHELSLTTDGSGDWWWWAFLMRDDGRATSEGTGPTPEEAVKDAAKRIGGTSGE